MNPANRSIFKNYIIAGFVIATILYGVVVVLVLRHDVQHVKANRHPVDRDRVDQ